MNKKQIHRNPKDNEINPILAVILFVAIILLTAAVEAI